MALRAISLATIAALLVVAIATGKNALKPQPRSFSLGSPETLPGNQFVVNHRRIKLVAGESHESPELLRENFETECLARGAVPTTDADTGVVSCPTFGETNIPERTFVQDSEADASTYLQWSPEEPIAFAELLPAAGEREGFDIEGVPRLPGSDRLMSSADPTDQYQTVFYSGAPGNVESAAKWYRGTLRELGWTLFPTSDDRTSRIYAHRAGIFVMVKLRDECANLCATVVATQL